MNLKNRIEVFAELGKWLQNRSPSELEQWIRSAKNINQWFTEESIKDSLLGTQLLLDKNNLETWLQKYSIKDKVAPQKVGLVMAGNIPLVGFHDFLSVLITGHNVYAKLSSQDNFLIKKLAEFLIDIEPAFKEKINFAERLNGMDAVIATGSDNSAKYFHYYFSQIPHIIRMNRSSVGILNGAETEEELRSLGKDILQYFGLGCRNISKLLVPEGYSFTGFFEAIEYLKSVGNNHKYLNNYEYNKSIYLLNKVVHLDNGFLLLTENESLVSPISVVYFDYYKDKVDLESKLAKYQDKIQITVSQKGWYKGSLTFGTAQSPMPWDYADGVDIIKFLSTL